MNICTERRTQLVEILSTVLNKLCELNDAFSLYPTPALDIKSYLWRIAHFTGCSEESLVLCLIYLDKLSEGNSRIIVTSHNVHRLLLTSALVAVKFNDDKHYNNVAYSQLGGVSLKELNNLEKMFLHEIKFELFVKSKTFRKYIRKFMRGFVPDVSTKRKLVKHITVPVEDFHWHLYSDYLLVRATNTSYCLESCQSQMFFNSGAYSVYTLQPPMQQKWSANCVYVNFCSLGDAVPQLYYTMQFYRWNPRPLIDSLIMLHKQWI